MEINIPLTILQIVGFLILLGVLWKFVFGQVSGFLRQREEEIRRSFEEIEAKQKEGEIKLAQLNERLAKIEHEATRKIQEAVKEGIAMRDQIREEARKQAEADLARHQEALRIDKEKAILELRQLTAKLMLEITEKVLQESVSPELQGRLVSRYVAELERMQKV